MTDVRPGTVTAGDLYRKLETMADSLIRVEERITVLPDFETRLRILEQFRWRLMGAAIGVGTAAGVVSGVISALITAHP